MKTVFVNLEKEMLIRVEEDSQFILNFPSYRPEDKYDFSLVFDKEGVSSEVIALYKLNSGDVLNLKTETLHKAPNTSCMIHIRGVLMDDSKSDYIGKIFIEKTAQKTQAFLKDNILVMGRNVVNNSSPVLQIDANDVKASHAATTGRVDEEQIYYLMSRGLNRREAEKLIVEGFFEYTMEDIKDAGIKNKIKNRYL
jgi:Fe-S cluster assembly protein SufD